ncbi:MAG TPA: hypothetical protein PKI19_10490 [Elusimicrobiales bacterium]|nr:hypothetical protein [Elusimicrobiales bacterium]
MPPIIADLIAKVKAVVSDATGVLLAIYAEKGIAPFKKPLATAVPTLLVLYLAVYLPLGDKLHSATLKLEASQAVSNGAGDYDDAKKRLLSYQAKLPLIADKDDWLNYVLQNSAKAHGISFEVFSAQTEEDAEDFMLASRNVELVTTYETLGKWLVDIENSPVFLRIVAMTAEKDSDNPLNVKVTLKLSTVFAKAKAGAPAAGGGAK